jgi:16S rRNA (guanine1516-N2)-methyltransferase
MTVEKAVCTALLTEIGIYPSQIELQALAYDLASKFDLKILDGKPDINGSLYLSLSSENLALLQVGSRQRLYVDFVHGNLGYRRTHKGKETLLRALGSNQAYIIDATAGLGRDACVLAQAGHKVIMLERCPALAALLANGLQRLQQQHELYYFSRNLNLIYQSAIDYLQQLSDLPDIIYLDPMYPTRRKSALVKQELRLIRQLVGDDVDSLELLQLALTKARKRVIIKRPRLAPALGLEANIPPPHACIMGKNTRYDFYSLI